MCFCYDVRVGQHPMWCVHEATVFDAVVTRWCFVVDLEDGLLCFMYLCCYCR